MKLSVLVFTFTVCLSFCGAYRFLSVYMLGGKSHFIMYNSLMKGLAKRGHQVDAISSISIEENEDNYTQVIKLSDMINLNDNMTSDQILWLQNFPLYSYVNYSAIKTCNNLLQPAVKKILEDSKRQLRYDAVIFHYMADFCFGALTKYLDVPMIALVTSAPYTWHLDAMGSTSNNAYMSNRLLSHTTSMTFSRRFSNVINTLKTRIYTWYMAKFQTDVLQELVGLGAPSVLSEMETKMSLLLTNSHMSMQGVLPLAPGIVEVGGLHIQGKREVLPPELDALLNGSSSGFVYVSFGTLVKFVSLPKERLDIFYKSFAKLAPVRVIIKVPSADQLPPGLPSNVVTLPWAPQLKVICHPNAKAFITHGGMLSTQEAIYCGIPVIVIPFFLDQFENADICMAKNLGIRLDMRDLTEEKFTTALKQILHNSTYSKSMKKMSQRFFDRPMNPMDTAIYWIEYVIKYGKDSLRPATNLTWWERELLDVYAFIIAIVVSLGFISVMLLKSLYKRLLHSQHETHTPYSKKIR